MSVCCARAAQVSAQQATIASAKQAAPERSAPPPTRYAFSANTSNLREVGEAGEPVVIFLPGESLAMLELPVQGGENASYRVTLSAFPEEEARLTELLRDN